MSGFIQQLTRAWESNDSLAAIGLDPDIERFPRRIAAQASPIFQFNKAIVDATADLVCAYKPQFAHYAAYEAEDQLERTIEYIHRSYPGVPVILDSKRGDVGNTAKKATYDAAVAAKKASSNAARAARKSLANAWAYSNPRPRPVHLAAAKGF